MCSKINFVNRIYNGYIGSSSQPSQFYTLIKDHKIINNDNQFLLRPIASVTNNPTNKIDWFCGKILNQLVNFVPAHLPSSLKLIQVLNDFDVRNIDNDNDYVFISMDLVNLYPSVPIDTALRGVIEFAQHLWDKIDNFGVSIEQIRGEAAVGGGRTDGERQCDAERGRGRGEVRSRG